VILSLTQLYRYTPEIFRTKHRTNRQHTQHRKLKRWATRIPPVVLEKDKQFLFIKTHPWCYCYSNGFFFQLEVQNLCSRFLYMTLILIFFNNMVLYC
jgi:hypothetical protein